jgi:chemosensory pili system protein ChpA (sensor histidine kinase/response regulator)
MEHTIETDLNQTGFLEEARGYSPLVVACLDALAANLDDRIALDEIFRLAHTIRGAGGTAGLEEVSTIAQGAEELAEAILNGDLPMDAESVDLFREAFNGLFEAIERAAPVADGGAPKPKAKKNARPQMVETVRAEDVPPELIEGFLIEAAENLALVETSLAEFELDQSKKQLLKDARRGVHTIKGAGGMVGQWTLAKLAKRVEDLLDEVYDGERKWSEDLRDLVEASRGALSDVVASGGNPAGHEELLAALHEAYDLLNPAEETVAPPVPEKAANVTIAPDAPMGDGLLEGFLEEAAGLLEGLDGLIAGIPASRETVQEVRRRVHTIKGSAGMVGLRGLSQIAHRMEDLLDRLYEGTVEHSAGLEALLTATGDTIADMLGHGGTAAAYTDRLLALYRRYDEIGNDAAVSEPEEPPLLALVPARTPAAAAAEPPPASNEAGAQHVRVPIEKLDEMVRLVGELFAVRSSFDRSLAGYRHEIGELELTLRRLRRIATQFENEYAIYSPGVTDGPAATRSAHGADRSEFDALEFDRYTQFHLLSRDLMEAVSDIATAEHLLTTLAGDFDLSLNRQGRLTSEVQDRLMHLRRACSGLFA